NGDYKGALIHTTMAVADFFTMGGASVVKDIAEETPEALHQGASAAAGGCVKYTVGVAGDVPDEGVSCDRSCDRGEETGATPRFGAATSAQLKTTWSAAETADQRVGLCQLYGFELRG